MLKKSIERSHDLLFFYCLCQRHDQFKKLGQICRSNILWAQSKLSSLENGIRLIHPTSVLPNFLSAQAGLFTQYSWFFALLNFNLLFIICLLLKQPLECEFWAWPNCYPATISSNNVPFVQTTKKGPAGMSAPPPHWL